MFLVVILLVGMMMMMTMMMMMPGGSHKVERGSELQHIFSPGPNSNQQMVRMIMMIKTIVIVTMVSTSREVS